MLGLGGAEKQPENYEYQMTIAPNHTAEIEFRMRRQ